MRPFRWPSRDHRDYQAQTEPGTCRRVAAPPALVEPSLAQGPRGGPVHVVKLQIGQGSTAGEYVWSVSFPLN